MYQESLFTEQETRLLPPRSIWKLRQRGVFLGTSGYSYEDWIGPFYRYGTKKPQMLEYYQHFFPATELNYTYYSMPRPSTLFQIRNKAPNMMFSVKAHQSITHERRTLQQNWLDFADAMMVLSDADQLACVLFQFPYSFKCTNDNFGYLDELLEYFNTFRIVLELRHASWHHDTTYSYSRKRGITLCSVDAPRLPGLTSNVMYPGKDLAYVRLHGRNAQNWFDGDNITRYDYRYTPEEIADIVRKIVSLIEASHHVYLFANNHPRAQAVETVTQIAQALDHHPALAAL
ncbi:MAG: DUF72 domain-containing protein [Ignavibacteria bacterium]|nr:MAG: DUF72 domain-containing protein [Ignavibacteria bacterium]